MRKKNDKMRNIVREMRKKGDTYWEISKVLKISPQMAHYYGKDIKLSTAETLTKEK